MKICGVHHSFHTTTNVDTTLMIAITVRKKSSGARKSVTSNPPAAIASVSGSINTGAHA